MNADAADAAATRHGIAKRYLDVAEMLDAERPDFVDIITRPDSHLSIVREAARRGIAIICQKALAPTFDQAKEIVSVAESAGAPLMVHENFRFQPWYREIRTPDLGGTSSTADVAAAVAAALAVGTAAE